VEACHERGGCFSRLGGGCLAGAAEGAGRAWPWRGAAAHRGGHAGGQTRQPVAAPARAARIWGHVLHENLGSKKNEIINFRNFLFP